MEKYPSVYLPLIKSTKILSIVHRFFTFDERTKLLHIHFALSLITHILHIKSNLISCKICDTNREKTYYWFIKITCKCRPVRTNTATFYDFRLTSFLQDCFRQYLHRLPFNWDDTSLSPLHLRETDFTMNFLFFDIFKNNKYVHNS